MNNDQIISDDIIKYQASASYADLIKLDESKKQFLNLIKFYLFTKYPNSYKSIYI